MNRGSYNNSNKTATKTKNYFVAAMHNRLAVDTGLRDVNPTSPKSSPAASSIKSIYEKAFIAARAACQKEASSTAVVAARKDQEPQESGTAAKF